MTHVFVVLFQWKSTYTQCSVTNTYHILYAKQQPKYQFQYIWKHGCIPNKIKPSKIINVQT